MYGVRIGLRAEIVLNVVNNIGVKTFFTFFILVTFFYVFNVFFKFSKRFFIYKKRWQSSEQQAD